MSGRPDPHANPYGIPPCTGSSVCGLSCCRGWDIAFTDGDLERLKALDETYVSMAGTCHGEGQDKVCAFLREDGLCLLYARHGRESLPELCLTYPEGKGVFDGVVEYAPDPGCPEVVLRLMQEEDRDLWQELPLSDPSPFLTRQLKARRFLLRLLSAHPYRFFHIKMKMVFGVLCGMRDLIAAERLDEDTLQELLSFYDGLEYVEEDRLAAEEYADPVRHAANACRQLYRLFHALGNGEFLLHLMREEKLLSRAETLLQTPGAMRDACASFADAYGETLQYLPYNFMGLALYRDFLTEVPERFGNRFLAMCVIFSLASFRMVLLHADGKPFSQRELAVQVSLLSRTVYHSPYAVRLIAEHLKANGFATPDKMESLTFTLQSGR